MADFGSPVANTGTYNPTQGLTSLATLYGIKNGQAQNRLLQAELPGTQAQSQLEQQNATQQAAVAKYFNTIKPQEHTGKDGTVDLNYAVQTPEFQSLGSAAPEVLQKLTDLKKSQIGNIQDLSNLSKDLRGQYNDTMGSLLQDKDVQEGNAAGFQKVRDQADALAQTNPALANVVASYKNILDKVPTGDKDPTALAHYIQSAQLRGMAAETQNSAQTPREIDKGGTLQDISLDSPSGNVGGATGIKKTLAPTDQVDYQTQLAAAKSQTEANFTNVSNNRNAASIAPQQLNQINNALKLSQSVSTGAGTAERAKLESGISALIPGFDKLQNDAAKVQELNKYLARITTDSEKVLGANATTDASRDAIAQQNASIGYAPQAVQNVLKYAGAQTLAMQAKGNAQEAWLNQSGNGITNQHEFETAWRKAYDPVVFQLEEAGSKAEQQKIINGLSPEEAASLSKKRADLKALGVELP